MTNHIELMMKTAGVEPTITYFEAVNPLAEISSAKSVTKVRSFTAEKQLEIIKLIGLQGNVCIAKRHYGNCNWMITTHHKNGFGDTQDFPQALAQLTTKLMNAGELDKSKVKEIVEQ